VKKVVAVEKPRQAPKAAAKPKVKLSKKMVAAKPKASPRTARK
jgi:hypothetical protein